MRESITNKTVANNSDYEQVGLMLDLSRGKVLTVEKVCETIKYASNFGFTYINLYIEDLLTLNNYPQYGYMRGRYLDTEIEEIVDYANSLNVEIFPAIQTLGHFEHFLRWSNSDSIRDTGMVVDVTKNETYDFIDELIRKCKDLFKGKKINIGMDEAFDLGQGAVFRSGSEFTQKELYLNHLKKVTEICKKYDYTTISIWSDMLFSTYSNIDGESLYNTNFRTKIEELDPALELIFWNYWSEGQETYETILDAHHNFSDNVAMALGIHTWGLPFYNLNQLEVTKTALRACKKKGVKNILFTMWGDDGSLFNRDSTLLGMYETMSHILGHNSTKKEFESLVNLDYDELLVVCKILNVGINPLHVLWNDPITNVYLKFFKREELQKISDKAREMKINKKGEMYEIYDLYLDNVINGIELYLNKYITDELIDKNYYSTKVLYEKLEILWMRDAKFNSLEELQLRFENRLARLEFFKQYKEHEDVESIRAETVEGMEHIKKMYSIISKPTNFRW